MQILKGRELTDDEYFKSAVLGWCVELVRLPSPSLYCLYSRNDSRHSSKRSSSSRTT